MTNFKKQLIWYAGKENKPLAHAFGKARFGEGAYKLKVSSDAQKMCEKFGGVLFESSEIKMRITDRQGAPIKNFPFRIRFRYEDLAPALKASLLFERDMKIVTDNHGFFTLPKEFENIRVIQPWQSAPVAWVLVKEGATLTSDPVTFEKHHEKHHENESAQRQRHYGYS